MPPTLPTHLPLAFGAPQLKGHERDSSGTQEVEVSDRNIRSIFEQATLPSLSGALNKCPLVPVSATPTPLSVQRIPRIALAADLIRQRRPKTRIARDARINWQRNQTKSSARFTHGNRQSGEKPPPSLIPKGGRELAWGRMLSDAIAFEI